MWPAGEGWVATISARMGSENEQSVPASFGPGAELPHAPRHSSPTSPQETWSRPPMVEIYASERDLAASFPKPSSAVRGQRTAEQGAADEDRGAHGADVTEHPIFEPQAAGYELDSCVIADRSGRAQAFARIVEPGIEVNPRRAGREGRPGGDIGGPGCYGCVQLSVSTVTETPPGWVRTPRSVLPVQVVDTARSPGLFVTQSRVPVVAPAKRLACALRV